MEEVGVQKHVSMRWREREEKMFLEDLCIRFVLKAVRHLRDEQTAFSALDAPLTCPSSSSSPSASIQHVFLPARHHVRHGVVGLLHGVHGPVRRARAGLLL